MYMLTRLRSAPDTSMLFVACLISSFWSTPSTYGYRPASIISPTLVLWPGTHSYTLIAITWSCFLNTSTCLALFSSCLYLPHLYSLNLPLIYCAIYASLLSGVSVLPSGWFCCLCIPVFRALFR
ncbi:hypothetical protein HD554DRAFT_2061237 [Boletus coccyginus]|nr:hypothetical protein HD554DRAFT_2061237 [Boletus coccyginus]